MYSLAADFISSLHVVSLLGFLNVTAASAAAVTTAAGKALMAGEGSRIQGLSIDLWTISKGQKELKLVRPKGTVPCQVGLCVMCFSSRFMCYVFC